MSNPFPDVFARRVRGGRLGTAALALAVALGAVPASATSAAAAPGDRDGAGRTTAAGPETSLTLITGDRVVLRGDEVVEVRPGPGRERMLFTSSALPGGGRTVIPADAEPLLAAGRLDRRLFDVTTLREWGHTDAARRDIPLIVTGTAGTGAAAKPAQPSSAQLTTAELTRAGARRSGRLDSRRFQAVRAPKEQAGRVWAALDTQLRQPAQGSRASGQPTKVWLDGRAELNLDVSVPQIGAPAAWQAGYAGRGTRIAVLDSGIDADHPDFAGRLGEIRNFSETPDADDTVGHGTHVASIAAGSGAASGGRFRGVAPEATLMIGKVCESEFCTESGMLAGMQWAASSGADVVNMSLGHPDSAGNDPLEQAVDDLTARYGTLFVISAGNRGDRETVGSPGAADAALTVGAVDSEDRLADFSSQGPRVGDGAIKPDITAPGVRIAAARARDSRPENPLDEHYVRYSGTSMAAPHATGAAALLAQRHPTWTATELKAALMGSAEPDPDLDVFAQGSGRLDVARAITQPVTAGPGSLSLGTARWPHDDDQPITRTLTYRNHGDAPVTLALSVDASGPGGADAPGGMFALSASEVTVAAGGEAAVTLTADTRVSAPAGRYSGVVTAGSGDLSLRTLLTIEREGEMYDLELVHIGRDGQPPPSFNSAVSKMDEPLVVETRLMPSTNGTVTLRLPKGRYALHSWIIGDDPADLYGTDFSQPLVEVDRDQTITLDARTARPMKVSVPDPAARQFFGVVRSNAKAFVDLNTWVAGSSLDWIYTAHLGPTVPDDQFGIAAAAKFGAPGPGGDFHNSPYVYNLVFAKYGRSFDGLRRAVTARELATVAAGYGVERPGRRGMHRSDGRPDGRADLALGRNLTFDLPFRRTEYYLTVPDVVWWHEFNQLVPDPETWEVASRSAASYRARHRYTERWNEPVYAPTGGTVRQVRDELSVEAWLHGDAGGHHGALDAATGRTTLRRDGVQLAESESPGRVFAQIPPGPATYRMDAELERTGGFDLSIRQSGTWTFRAGGRHDVPLDTPLLATRFTPSVDASGGAPAGRWFQIPVTVAGVAAGARASRPKVEISFDDGASWKAVDLTRHGSMGWTAKVRHPAGGGFASLRASVTDTAGNTATHTTIHAYRLVATANHHNTRGPGPV